MPKLSEFLEADSKVKEEEQRSTEKYKALLKHRVDVAISMEKREGGASTEEAIHVYACEKTAECDQLRSQIRELEQEVKSLKAGQLRMLEEHKEKVSKDTMTIRNFQLRDLRATREAAQLNKLLDLPNRESFSTAFLHMRLGQAGILLSRRAIEKRVSRVTKPTTVKGEPGERGEALYADREIAIEILQEYWDKSHSSKRWRKM